MFRFIYVVSFLLLFVSLSFAESYTVRRGDTLSGILSNRFNAQDILEINKGLKSVAPKFILKTGMKIFFNEENIVIDIAIDKNITIKDKQVTLNKYEPEVLRVLITGEISTNLFDAILKAGEDAELASMVAAIFEWEIDFFKDLRRGDKFAIYVEKKFVNDKYAGYGKVVAADFYNKNRVNRAIHYDDGKTSGYFTENGRALERGFLRLPISYARVTSRFTDSRLHPVFKTEKPHYGVDYAAKVGTPVMATATGTVASITYNNANGNYIELTHTNGYRTFYLHLNGFNKALRKGSVVTQGQIIGYVGSTGYSTGPHLDYRIKLKNKWLNPLKFIANEKAINKKSLPAFYEVAAIRTRILDNAFPVYASYSKDRAFVLIQ